jgi:hypothetical protein
MAKKLNPVQEVPRNFDPFTDAAAVTPSDTVDLVPPCRGLWVGSLGNVTVVMVDYPSGATPTVEFVAVPAGTHLPVCCRRVMSTGTSAGSILALY